MLKSNMFLSLVAAFGLSILSAPSLAQLNDPNKSPPKILDVSEDKPKGWQTWMWENSCFAILYAENTNSETSQPGTPYLSIKNSLDKHNWNGVAVISGLINTAEAEATIDVNGHEFPLLVYNGNGFVKSGSPEESLIEAIKKSNEITVTWSLKSGLVIHKYKTEGFEKVHKMINQFCPRPTTMPQSPETENPKKK